MDGRASKANVPSEEFPGLQGSQNYIPGYQSGQIPPVFPNLYVDHGTQSQLSASSIMNPSHGGRPPFYQTIPGSSRAPVLRNSPGSFGELQWDHYSNSQASVTSSSGRSRNYRRMMTDAERSRMRALRAHGGACKNCRRKKKRCDHKDVQMAFPSPGPRPNFAGRQSNIEPPRVNSQHASYITRSTGQVGLSSLPDGSTGNYNTNTGNYSIRIPSPETSVDINTLGLVNQELNTDTDVAKLGYQFDDAC